MNRKNSVEDFLVDEEFVRWVKNSDPELEVFWSKWLKLNPGKRELMMEARELLVTMEVTRHKVPHKVKERSLDYILSETQSTTPVRTLSPVRKSYMLYKMAGVLLLVICAAFIIRQYIQKPVEVPLAPAISTITKTNPYGQRSKIRLPDGTTVWLNAGSIISYPSEFVGQERIVDLEGQAFFDVKRDTLRPFRVHSSGLITTALGTSFDISSYTGNNEEIKISLVSGKVSIENQSLKSYNVLDPGEQLVYSVNDQQSTVRSFDLKEVVAWKDGVLMFNNASFEEVVDRLGRWYGVEIVVENSPTARWDLNGEFKRQSLERVLERLSFTKGFQYTINEKVVVIKF